MKHRRRDGAQLAVVPRLHDDGRRSYYDPDPPPELITTIKHWHGGKAATVARERVVTPWSSIQLYDETGREIHSVDYLDPSVDDADLVLEIWDKVKSRTRYFDDAHPHDFTLECSFADLEGNATSADELYLKCRLPRENGRWGDQTGYAQARFGRMLKDHPAPHLAHFDIEAMAMAHGLVDKLYQRFEGIIQSQERTISKLVDREESVLRREREVSVDERKKFWEEQKLKAGVGLVKVLGGRLAKLLPLLGLKASDAFANKFLGKVKEKTAREEDAYDFLVYAAEAAERQIKAANGGKEVDPREFKKILSAKLGIPEDHPVWRKLFRTMLEAAAEKSRREIQDEAASPIPVEVVIDDEPKPSATQEAPERPAKGGAEPATKGAGADAVVRKLAEFLAAEIRKRGFPVTEVTLRMALVQQGFEDSDEAFFRELFASLRRSGARVFDGEAAPSVEPRGASFPDQTPKPPEEVEATDGEEEGGEPDVGEGYDPREEFGEDDDEGEDDEDGEEGDDDDGS